MLYLLHKISEKLSFKPSKKALIVIVTLIFSISGLFYYFFVRPPADFPLNTIYSIEEKRTLSEVANGAKKDNIIKSSMTLKVLITLFSRNKGAISGDYILNKKENIFQIAQRLAKGDYRLSAVKVTVPEGYNIYEIAELLSKKDDLRNFNQQEFISLAKDKEGYLYPDTYYFLPNIKSKQMIETMEENFNRKVLPIQKDVKKFGKTFKEVVTMASILEDEVPKSEDRKIVAGILWKRLEKGMSLQVDAPFYYITAKPGNFTLDDLKIDSPYNTYKYKGLPKGPISNPGLEAILDTITPINTPYWFYLTDEKGEMRYAETYDGHLANINKYLR